MARACVAGAVRRPPAPVGRSHQYGLFPCAGSEGHVGLVCILLWRIIRRGNVAAREPVSEQEFRGTVGATRLLGDDGELCQRNHSEYVRWRRPF